MSGRSEPAGAPRGRAPLGVLLIAVGFEVLVAVGGLVVPGSILVYPFSISAPEPITVIYDFPNGRLVALTTFVLLSLGFVASLAAAARLDSSSSTLTREGEGRMVLVVATAVPLVVAYVLAYPTGSTDIFHNVADARTLWKYHEWPMVVPPGAHPEDPVVAHVPAWRDTTTKYGPLAYVGVVIPSMMAGDALLSNLVWFKVYNGLLLLLLACLVGWAATFLSPGRQMVATAMVAWNPLLLYEAVANGHNDVLMALFAVAALLLAWRHRTLSSFAALAMGAGVKFVIVLVAPLTWAWLWVSGDRHDRAILGGLGAAGAAAFMIAYGLFADRILAGAGPAAGQGVVGSPISVLAYALEPWLGFEGFQIARGICLIALALIVVAFLPGLNSTPRSLWRAWVWTLFGLALLAATQVYPWYLMWAIPIAAIAPGTRESDVAVLSSLLGLISYAFWPWQPVEVVGGEPRPSAIYNFAFVLAFFGLPALYVLLAPRLRAPTTATLFARPPADGRQGDEEGTMAPVPSPSGRGLG